MEEKERKQLGRKIRAHRMMKGWRGEQLAEHIDKSSSWVSMIENGKVKDPGVGALRKIAEVLDTTLYNLLEEKGVS